MEIPKKLHQEVESRNAEKILSLLEQLPSDALQSFADRYFPRLASEGYESIIKYLHRHRMVLGARDETGATVLHYAALGGHLELVQYLHQEGADIHARDTEGTTLLHGAAICGELALIRYLCEQSLAVNAANNNGHTALHLVVVTGMLRERVDPVYIALEEREIIAYLQQQGGDLEVADHAGKTVRELLTTWKEGRPASMWISKQKSRDSRTTGINE